MKQGTVKFSKEFITPIGLKEWVGIEMEYDMNTECPRDVLTNAKTIVEQWHKESSAGYPNLLNPDLQYTPGPSTELPVINKAEERLGILIENATTKEELMNYKNDLSTPYLSNLFSAKLQNFKQ